MKSTLVRMGRTRPSLPARAVPEAGLLLAAGLLFLGWAPATWAAGDDLGSPPSGRALSLPEARELALAGGEQVRQAELALLGADADVMEASAGRLPQLAVGGTWTRNLKKPVFFLPPDMAAGFGGNTAIEMGGDWDLQAAATLTWNLWTAGRLGAARHLAQETRGATEWQRDIVRDGVVYTVEAAYFGVLLAAEQVDIAGQAQAAATEALRVTQAAFDQGKASNFDLLRARVELANRIAPQVQARNLLHLHTLQLLRICGLDPGSPVTLTDSLAVVPPPGDLDELLASMRGGSPELRSLTHLVAARRQALGLARAARGPLVQLMGQYAVQGQWDDEIVPTGDESVTSASAALAVSLPIFDGFSAKAGIQRSAAGLRSAEIELERVTRDRELAVRQARLNLENSLAALNGRQEAVDLASEAYRLALVRVENGLSTALERLDAELALTQARVQLAESLYNCNLAEAGLKLAVGGSEPHAFGSQENSR